MLLSTLIDTNDHQGTQLRLLSSKAAVNTIGPDINPLILVQAFVTPVTIFLCPRLFQELLSKVVFQHLSQAAA